MIGKDNVVFPFQEFYIVCCDPHRGSSSKRGFAENDRGRGGSRVVTGTPSLSAMGQEAEKACSVHPRVAGLLALH